VRGGHQDVERRAQEHGAPRPNCLRAPPHADQRNARSSIFCLTNVFSPSPAGSTYDLSDYRATHM
jgi:hypothetical protein